MKNKKYPWQRLLRAKEPHQVSFHWVKGHDGHPENERCDQLATADSLPTLGEGSEKTIFARKQA